MNWYLVHTKPRQELLALENLERQNYSCYLPTMPVEKIRDNSTVMVEEPLFPRYLFIRSAEDMAGAQWGALRSTRGVVKLVGFGAGPVGVKYDFLKDETAVPATCWPDIIR